MKITLGKIELDEKKSILVCGAIILVIVLFAVLGFCVGKITKFDEEVISKVSDARKEVDGKLNEAKQQLSGVLSEIDAKKSVIEDVEEFNANREQLEQQYQSRSAEISSLDTQIATKQSELDTLTGNIIKAKSAPKTLSAGQFMVGADLPSGRYNVSGSSNFVVRSASGSLKVNTILGDSSVGRGDYVCTLATGDSMELHARTTFTPIE